LQKYNKKTYQQIKDTINGTIFSKKNMVYQKNNVILQALFAKK